MRAAAAIALSVLAVALGLWHMRLALDAILVFRAGEPWTSWIAVLCGFVSTLPAAILSFFLRRTAGYWLIGNAVVALGVLAMEEGEMGDLLGLLAIMIGPILAVGIGFVILSRQEESVAG